MYMVLLVFVGNVERSTRVVGGMTNTYSNELTQWAKRQRSRDETPRLLYRRGFGVKSSLRAYAPMRVQRLVGRWECSFLAIVLTGKAGNVNQSYLWDDMANSRKTSLSPSYNNNDSIEGINSYV